MGVVQEEKEEEGVGMFDWDVKNLGYPEAGVSARKAQTARGLFEGEEEP